MPVARTTLAARSDALANVQRFVRQNPWSDLFPVKRFHHVEFWCPDATNAYKRFQVGLGMRLVAKSDQATGNSQFASYVLQSGDLTFAFTAPYGLTKGESVHPTFHTDAAFRFVQTHGFSARAVGISVEDAAAAFTLSVENGAVPLLPPVETHDAQSGQKQVVAEVEFCGDAVLRFVSGDFSGPYLTHCDPLDGPKLDYGLRSLDHVAVNVEQLNTAVEHLQGFTGFHHFAEFTAEDVGTVDSGLNSQVLASNDENVMVVLNEPTRGTRCRSQIQTYLEQHRGPGVQHLAMKTDDIFSCLRHLKSQVCGFEFMPPPSEVYYRRMPQRIGDSLTQEQYKEVEELGILVDKDDQGVLMQIFTRPVSDRSTLFLEVVQRVGCETESRDEKGDLRVMQKGGCGGFGKGNISELFRSVEEYERDLAI